MADPIARSVAPARLRPGKAAARSKLIAIFMAGLFLLVTGLFVQAQEKSLAEIARETRTKKAAAKAGAKVYDDDTLPRSSTSTTAASGGSSAPSQGVKADEKSATTAADAPAPLPSSGNNPDERRAAIFAQKKRIADLEDELNRLERENRTLVAQDDSDKTRRPPTCGSGTFCMGTEETSGKRKEYDKQHDAKQAELAAARKKLDDMQQDARKRGISVQ